jgi:hypothetical protein
VQVGVDGAQVQDGSGGGMHSLQKYKQLQQHSAGFAWFGEAQAVRQQGNAPEASVGT